MCFVQVVLVVMDDGHTCILAYFVVSFFHCGGTFGVVRI